MNKFLIRLVKNLSFFLIIIFMYVSIAIYINVDDPNSYPAVIIDKYSRLKELKDQNKIVIIGGSSSCYSINSKLLSEEFALPVVNTSIAMAIEASYQVNSIKKYLKKGDIVLGFHEYEYYFGNDQGGDFMNTSLFYYPNMFFDFTTTQRFNFLKSSVRLSSDFYKGKIIGLLAPKKKPLKIGQYSRKSYDINGDNVFLLDKVNGIYEPNPKNRYQRMKKKKLSKEYRVMMKEFHEFCVEKGIRLFLGYPPLETSE